MIQRYEVTESKAWRRDDGLTASIYGAIPWTAAGEAARWKLITRGYTVRDTVSGTVGVGRMPWPTREEAQAWADAQNKRLHDLAVTREKAPGARSYEEDMAAMVQKHAGVKRGGSLRAGHAPVVPAMATAPRRKAPAKAKMPLKDRLFIAVFSTGISYTDRASERNGDYRKLAFLPFSTLALEWFAKKVPPELRSEIERHAKTLQDRRGESYPISASGQTITLGKR